MRGTTGSLPQRLHQSRCICRQLEATNGSTPSNPRDALAAEIAGVVPDLRAGKIIGTATLISILGRFPVGLLGPAPFDGELDEPDPGVISGFGQMVRVDADRPWKGGRWVLKSESGRRYPLTLSMMLFDSSGVNKD